MKAYSLLKIIIPGVVLLLLGAAIGQALLSNKDAGSPPRQQAGDELETAVRLEAVEARLDRIDRALATISDRLGTHATRSRSQSGGVEEGRADQESEVAIAQDREGQVIAYANAFRNQKVDPKWGLPTEALLLGKIGSDHILSIQAELPDTREIKCRTDMCQMRFGFSDSGDAIDWTDAYLTGLGSSLGRTWSTFETHPDGSVVVLVYGFKSK